MIRLEHRFIVPGARRNGFLPRPSCVIDVFSHEKTTTERNQFRDQTERESEREEKDG